jgi:hypothetical protein
MQKRRKKMAKTLLNTEEIESMILAEVRKYDYGENIAEVTIADDVDEDGNPTFTVGRLRASGGPVLGDAKRKAIAYAKTLRSQYGVLPPRA